jgi:hypothetical protein
VELHHHRSKDTHNGRVILPRALTTTDTVSFGRDGPSLGRGALRSFGGFVFTIGALGLIIGVAMFLLGFVPLMENPDSYSGPPDQVITGFVIAGIGMVVTWIGQIVRGWERKR